MLQGASRYRYKWDILPQHDMSVLWMTRWLRWMEEWSYRENNLRPTKIKWKITIDSPENIRYTCMSTQQRWPRDFLARVNNICLSPQHPFGQSKHHSQWRMSGWWWWYGRWRERRVLCQFIQVTDSVNEIGTTHTYVDSKLLWHTSDWLFIFETNFTLTIQWFLFVYFGVYDAAFVFYFISWLLFNFSRD